MTQRPQVLVALESGNSIPRAAQRLDQPYETVRQAVDRLEEAGYVRYDDGLSIEDDSVRTEARELVAASARVSAPSIGEAYDFPHFGDSPFAFTRVDAVYVWTHGGYQVGRDPEDYPLFIAFASRTSTIGRRSSNRSASQPHSSASPGRSLTDLSRSCSNHDRRSTSIRSKGPR